MSALYDWFVELHVSHPHLPKALLAGTLVAVVCSVIGCFIVLRRMAFLGDALAHAMLAGVVAGYLLMQIVFGQEAHAPAMLIGSIIAGFVTVAMIGFVSKLSRVKEDTAIGLMYTGIFAAGGVLASVFTDRIHLDLYHFVVGTVLAVENSELWMMAVIAAAVLAVVILFFRQFQITTFDPVMAASIGVPVLLFDYVLTACTSVVVVSAVNIVGMILVVGLLVTPAATAYLLCDRLGRMLVLSSLFGVSAIFGGVFFSEAINVATGAAIVLVGTVQFLVVLAIAPRYGLIAGWLRRRSMVPQQIVEDVLGCLRRGRGKPVPPAELSRYVEGTADQVQRAVRTLRRQDLVEAAPEGLLLTEAGALEARRLLRSHRLWETYLEHVGTPAEQLHGQAHQLEHLHDEATVDYLDDKLGHPLTDPHGSEIPEDFVDLVPGNRVKASLLRKGRRARVVEVGGEAADTALRSGMEVIAGERSPDGKVWNLLLPDGRKVSLDHAAADAVTVEVASRKP